VDLEGSGRELFKLLFRMESEKLCKVLVSVTDLTFGFKQIASLPKKRSVNHYIVEKLVT
jgi:hypothetical protein